MNLTGAASSDTDGTITAYAWSQTAGPAVTLTSASSATRSFAAPQVTGATALAFQLTVTDNGGAQASDSVTVTVNDAPADTTPPVTTKTDSRYRVSGKWVHDITLSANEPATTYWRITNIALATVTAGGTTTTAWQPYTGLITVRLNGGTTPFEWYSVDTAGSTEATLDEDLQ